MECSGGNKFVTIPNFLTVLRIAATPLLVWMYFAGFEPLVVATCYFAATLTDFFDGKLARLLRQESVAGEWLDPIADKIATIPFLYIFWSRGEIFSLVFWLILFREVFITIGRAIVLKKGKRAPARQLGKIKFVCECAGVTLLLAGFLSFGQFALLLAVVFAYISLVHYMLIWGFIPKAVRDFCFERFWLPIFVRVVHYLG